MNENIQELTTQKQLKEAFPILNQLRTDLTVFMMKSSTTINGAILLERRFSLSLLN